MNLFDFLSPFVSTKLCLVLLHSLWQMSLLIGVVWLAERISSRRKQVAQLDDAETRYAINVAALGVGLLLLPITWAALDNPVVKATSATGTTPTANLQQNLSGKLSVNRTNIVSNLAGCPDTGLSLDMIVEID